MSAANEETGGLGMEKDDRSAMVIIAEYLVREEGEKFKAAMREHMPMLQKIASADDELPWHYTDRCNMCGGTKAFLDWLEKKVNQ